MPRNSNGKATRVNPPGAAGYQYGTVINQTQVNNEINDIYKELTNSIDKGGRTTPTANLKMGGYRHTGVGDAVADDDYATLGQAKALISFALTQGDGPGSQKDTVITFPTGDIIQLFWGYAGAVDNGFVSNTFPTAFPTACNMAFSVHFGTDPDINITSAGTNQTKVDLYSNAPGAVDVYAMIVAIGN